ncbi:MAG: type II toxin-antitoxin system RelE/ParE family toxin [Cyanobacteria bacterium J06560_6]
MPHTVRLTKKASKFYGSADKVLATKLARCFEVLEQTPLSHPNIKPLKGKLKGRYRYRIGNYRVIYRVNDQSVEVEVLQIGPRGDAYK